MYNGCRIIFGSAGPWSFDNDIVRIAIIFGVDKSSSFHAGNRKNKLLVLDEGLAFRINGRFCWPVKTFSINLVKQTQNLDKSSDKSFLFVNGKEIFKFKPDNEIVNFPTQFCVESISNGFSAIFSQLQLGW